MCLLNLKPFIIIIKKEVLKMFWLSIGIKQDTQQLVDSDSSLLSFPTILWVDLAVPWSQACGFVWQLD